MGMVSFMSSASVVDRCRVVASSTVEVEDVCVSFAGSEYLLESCNCSNNTSIFFLNMNNKNK